MLACASAFPFIIVTVQTLWSPKHCDFGRVSSADGLSMVRSEGTKLSCMTNRSLAYKKIERFTQIGTSVSDTDLLQSSFVDVQKDGEWFGTFFFRQMKRCGKGKLMFSQVPRPIPRCCCVVCLLPLAHSLSHRRYLAAVLVPLSELVAVTPFGQIKKTLACAH